MNSPLWLRAVVLCAIGIGALHGCGRDDGAARRRGAAVDRADIDTAALARFSDPKSVCGELVYVPIYSSVFHQTADREYLMTSTLSIHNIDLTGKIRISSVSYFDTEGDRVSEYLDKPAILGPLSTRQFVVPEKDRTGGAGANFLVKWESDTEVARPIIEAVMISTSGQQGLSFTTRGAVVRELR